MGNSSAQSGPKTRKWALLFAFVGLLAGLAGLIITLLRLDSSEAMQWPLIAILGITFLVALLAFMSVVFKEIGIGDSKYAFGLPQGSIRAFIALSLVVVFILFVTFLYYDLANPSDEPERKLEGISQEQLESIPIEKIISSTSVETQNVTVTVTDTEGTPAETETVTVTEDKYNVVLAPLEKSEASKDLAKQVVTLIGTLMTAVAAFYFGARVGDRKEAKETPSLTVASPAGGKIEMQRGEGKKITIKLKAKPEGENIHWDEPIGDQSGTVNQVKPGEWEYTQTDDKAEENVSLRFYLENYPDVESVITVKIPK